MNSDRQSSQEQCLTFMKSSIFEFANLLFRVCYERVYHDRVIVECVEQAMLSSLKD